MIAHPVWALVAVRDGKGKKRLAGLLDEEQRREIVMAMTGDVLRALVAAPSIDGVAVTTADPDLAALGERHGARVIADEGGGLNGALESARTRLMGDGAQALLIMHGDVPAVTPEAIERLLSAHQGGITIARAESDGGTNALLLTPPDAIRLHFGQASCAAHLATARQVGIPAQALAIPGLRHDIDRPEDLRRLARGRTIGETARLARDFGLADEGD